MFTELKTNGAGSYAKTPKTGGTIIEKPKPTETPIVQAKCNKTEPDAAFKGTKDSMIFTAKYIN